MIETQLEETAELKGPESKPSLAVSSGPIYCEEVLHWPPFYVLKTEDDRQL